MAKTAPLFSSCYLNQLPREEWKYTSPGFLERFLNEKPSGVSWSMQGVESTIERSVFHSGSPHRLVLVDGVYVEGLSRLDGISKDVCLEIKSNPAGMCASFEAKPLVVLNRSLLKEEVSLGVKEGVNVQQPVRICLLSTAESSPVSCCGRLRVQLEPGSRLQVIEEHISLGSGEYFTNFVTQLQVGRGARCCYFRIHDGAEQSAAIHQMYGALEQEAECELYAFSLQGAWLRQELEVNLRKPGARCQVFGLDLGKSRQHVDSFVRIHHEAPACYSRQLHKGIWGQQSVGVFYGQIQVRPGALHTDARQENRNLLLSSQAGVQTRPHLLINADDVKCSHGATVGQLDEEALFYLKSRGLSESSGKSLLVHAFAVDVWRAMPDKSLARALEKRLLSWMATCQTEGESAYELS